MNRRDTDSKGKVTCFINNLSRPSAVNQLPPSYWKRKRKALSPNKNFLKRKKKKVTFPLTSRTALSCVLLRSACLRLFRPQAAPALPDTRQAGNQGYSGGLEHPFQQCYRPREARRTVITAAEPASSREAGAHSAVPDSLGEGRELTAKAARKSGPRAGGGVRPATRKRGPRAAEPGPSPGPSPGPEDRAP